MTAEQIRKLVSHSDNWDGGYDAELARVREAGEREVHIARGLDEEIRHAREVWQAERDELILEIKQLQATIVRLEADRKNLTAPFERSVVKSLMQIDRAKYPTIIETINTLLELRGKSE